MRLQESYEGQDGDEHDKQTDVTGWLQKRSGEWRSGCSGSDWSGEECAGTESKMYGSIPETKHESDSQDSKYGHCFGWAKHLLCIPDVLRSLGSWRWYGYVLWLLHLRRSTAGYLQGENAVFKQHRNIFGLTTQTHTHARIRLPRSRLREPRQGARNDNEDGAMEWGKERGTVQATHLRFGGHG